VNWPQEGGPVAPVLVFLRRSTVHALPVPGTLAIRYFLARSWINRAKLLLFLMRTYDGSEVVVTRDTTSWPLFCEPLHNIRLTYMA
jgi:hypothetical protein